MTKFHFEEIFGARDHVNNLGACPEKTEYILIQDQLTAWIDKLRQPSLFHNKTINNLMSLFWNLIGHKITPAAITPIHSISFIAEQRGTSASGIVLCPPHWRKLTKDDPYMQMGALVFCASQAKDYWNFKIPSSDKQAHTESSRRALMHESEFLFFLTETASDFAPNPYQQEVMNKFPKKLQQFPELSYEGMPFTLDKTQKTADGWNVEVRRPMEM